MELPTAGFTDECIASPTRKLILMFSTKRTVAFLHNINSNTCFRTISTLSTSCATELNISTYISFLVLKSSSETSTIMVQLEEVVTVNGTITTSAPFPTTAYDATNQICNNAVFQVSYTVVFSGTTISSINAKLTVGSVEATVARVEQEFLVFYVEESSTTIFERSGNPGYIVGKPILAGQVVTNSEKYHSHQCMLIY